MTTKLLAIAAPLTILAFTHVNAQSQSHDHAGHDHSAKGHSCKDHNHNAAPAIQGDTIQLSSNEQRALGLAIEQVEMRDLPQSSGAIALPKTSVISERGKFYVFIQDPKESTKFIRTEVTLGQADDRYVDALSGVFPGDMVVAQGADQIGSDPVAEKQAAPSCRLEGDADFHCPLTSRQRSRVEDDRFGCCLESRRYRSSGRELPRYRANRFYDDSYSCPLSIRRDYDSGCRFRSRRAW